MRKYRPLFIVFSTAIVLGILGWWLISDADFVLFNPTGAVAKQQRDILVFALSLSAIVVIPVFLLYGIFSWRFRSSSTSKKIKYRPEWSLNVWLEVIWWGIPILIICALGTVAWKTAHTLDPFRAIDHEEKAIEVQVVALEWKWLFLYPEEGVATVNHLVIPEDTPVHFTIGADAPMSAFWIPTLGSQVYAMNGMSMQLNLLADEQGVYKGYNTNISGKGYSSMEFDVMAVSKRSYVEWVRDSSQRNQEFSQAEFDELLKPSVVGTSVYAFHDVGLYDRIIEKYMPHDMMDNMKMDGGHGSHGTQSSGAY